MCSGRHGFDVQQDGVHVARRGEGREIEHVLPRAPRSRDRGLSEYRVCLNRIESMLEGEGILKITTKRNENMCRRLSRAEVT